MNQGDTPRSEIGSELARMWHEIAGLRESVESLRRELAALGQTMGVLPAVPSAGYPVESAQERLEAQCNSYVDLISDIGIIREVLLSQSEQRATIWTIIDNPPAEDSPERPSYDDQRHTLAILEQNMPLDLQIVSVSEMAEAEQPGEMKLMWRRESA